MFEVFRNNKRHEARNIKTHASGYDDCLSQRIKLFTNGIKLFIRSEIQRAIRDGWCGEEVSGQLVD